MIAIVMGVSGSGKTAVGKAVAERMGFEFSDADDFHSAANKAKMGSGQPLDENDRRPWLAAMAEAILSWDQMEKGHVLACSGLKKIHRELLRDGLGESRLKFFYLRVDREELMRRLSERKGHYMKANMLDSQLLAFETPQAMEAYDIDNNGSMQDAVEAIVKILSAS